MKYQYENIFAKEYSGYQQISGGIEKIFQDVRGGIIKSWHGIPASGIYYIEVGSRCLLIWYKDPAHCKMRLDAKGLPEFKEQFPSIHQNEIYVGMEVQDMYVLSGNHPVICISLSDDFFAPEKDHLLQFILSSGESHAPIQIVSIPKVSPIQVLSTERISSSGHFKRIIQNEETEETHVGIIDGNGEVVVPFSYNDIDLISVQPRLYRTSIRKQVPGGDSYSLYGLCDSEGNERIACKYPDLYYMANGFILVMDYKGKWWVLDDQEEVIFGPHNSGVDICSHNKEYLYYIEYNSVAQCEALGIYSIELRTILTDADYIRIRYLGDHIFEAEQVFGIGDIRKVHINQYGEIVEPKSSSN